MGCTTSTYEEKRVQRRYPVTSKVAKLRAFKQETLNDDTLKIYEDIGRNQKKKIYKKIGRRNVFYMSKDDFQQCARCADHMNHEQVNDDDDDESTEASSVTTKKKVPTMFDVDNFKFENKWWKHCEEQERNLYRLIRMPRQTESSNPLVDVEVQFVSLTQTGKRGKAKYSVFWKTRINNYRLQFDSANRTGSSSRGTFTCKEILKRANVHPGMQIYVHPDQWDEALKKEVVTHTIRGDLLTANRVPQPHWTNVHTYSYVEQEERMYSYVKKYENVSKNGYFNPPFYHYKTYKNL